MVNVYGSSTVCTRPTPEAGSSDDTDGSPSTIPFQAADLIRDPGCRLAIEVGAGTPKTNLATIDYPY
jgi:hypothetical protein